LFLNLARAQIIGLTFQLETGVLTEPLWDVATSPQSYPNNAVFVREYTIKLLSASFPNMTTAEVIKEKLITFISLLLEQLTNFMKFAGYPIC